LADLAGFDSLWLTEDPEGWDAFAVLGAIASATSAIRIGTGVTNPFHRHPNLISASVATIDRLSAGRAFLGLGRGQPEWYARALGVPAFSPLALLEETLDLLDQWWTPPHRASSPGPIPIADWERSIHPIARPPIYLAAAGPRALDLAGRRADGVLFNELASPHFLAGAIDRVRAAARLAGRDPEQLAFFVNPAVRISDNPDVFLERKKSFIAMVYSLPGMDQMLDSPHFDTKAIMHGVRKAMRTEEILKRGGGFPDLRREGDLKLARSLIPTEFVAELSAIGSLETIGDRLRLLESIGATHIFLDRDGLPEEVDASTNLLKQLQQLVP